MDRIQAQQAQGQQQTEEHIALVSHSAPLNQDLLTEVDDLLAEIDGVLEENAEEFVKGFVQKGGQ